MKGVGKQGIEQPGSKRCEIQKTKKLETSQETNYIGRRCIEFFTSHMGCPVPGEDSVNSPRGRGEAAAACPGHRGCQAPVSEGSEVGPSLTELWFSPKAL